jgi:hypothetical protein
MKSIDERKHFVYRTSTLIIFLVPYILYILFIIRLDRGPIDYETFVAIGHRFNTGEVVYGENSYYPMPYVLVFAFLDMLPRPVSMALWLLTPVITALLITRGNPLTLLFAPTASHFLGGQTVLFSLIGFWGYRKFYATSSISGGIFLAIMTMKPQLALIPGIVAVIEWIKSIKANAAVPRQVWGFVLGFMAIYLPSFIIDSNWVTRWLANPRPLFERALSGFMPRGLLFFLPANSILFWIALFLLGSLVLYLIWRWNKKAITLDLAVLWGFMVNPFVHDYDLIQLIPLLEDRSFRLAAMVSSIPGWLVMLFSYQTDSAWAVFAFIAPSLLAAFLINKHQHPIQTYS